MSDKRTSGWPAVVGVAIGAASALGGAFVAGTYNSRTAAVDRRSEAAQHIADLRRDAYVEFFGAGVQVSIALQDPKVTDARIIADFARFLNAEARVELVATEQLRKLAFETVEAVGYRPEDLNPPTRSERARTVGEKLLAFQKLAREEVAKPASTGR